MAENVAARLAPAAGGLLPIRSSLGTLLKSQTSVKNAFFVQKTLLRFAALLVQLQLSIAFFHQKIHFLSNICLLMTAPWGMLPPQALWQMAYRYEF